ncbi:hypothetical protein [uncultured Lutibacter sp.]|uniref:hypothetical protein n=1 Tax=uncultured Lutibacter sp. TaxID=437739 RepID=UPI00261295E5|nr:hypothetical protein [uncultured Lutibacter sp.]
MRILLFTLFLAFSSISYGNVESKSFKTEYSTSWNYTTGYHSDGTSSPIRYTIDAYGDISDIEIEYQGYWYTTYVKWDNSRKYVKNPNNKRYYF